MKRPCNSFIKNMENNCIIVLYLDQNYGKFMKDNTSYIIHETTFSFDSNNKYNRRALFKHTTKVLNKNISRILIKENLNKRKHLRLKYEIFQDFCNYMTCDCEKCNNLKYFKVRTLTISISFPKKELEKLYKGKEKLLVEKFAKGCQKYRNYINKNMGLVKNVWNNI